MTIFDLLFLLLLLTAVVSLIAAAGFALAGRRTQAAVLLRRLAIGTVAYVGVVYVATALLPQTVLHKGDPECSDDWCIAVDGATRSGTHYQVTLRIFSRALGRAQRELIATDVYLVDANWNRYQAVPDPANIPLNTLLQPGESVTTQRAFELPPAAQGIGLMIGRSTLPVCLIIGECGAFHKDTVIRLD